MRFFHTGDSFALILLTFGSTWGQTETHLLHGLWSRPLREVLDFIAHHNFNAIRVPFAANLALDLDGTQPTSVNTYVNPDLKACSLRS